MAVIIALVTLLKVAQTFGEFWKEALGPWGWIVALVAIAQHAERERLDERQCASFEEARRDAGGHPWSGHSRFTPTGDR